MTHTPTPWKWTPCEIEKEPDGTETIYKCADITNAKGKTIFPIDMDGYMGLDDDTAAFIVKAVNCHEEFIGLLQGTLDYYEIVGLTGPADLIRKAIAKAEGK